MKRKSTQKKPDIKKLSEIKFDKINVFFKKSILNTILKMLTMQHPGFRTVKSVKSIHKLFTNIDESKYNTNKELESYIWCIKFISKQWIDGIVNIDLIYEGAKRSTEFDNIKDELFTRCANDEDVVTDPEAKMIFSLIGEALQYGYITSLKEEYMDLLDDIDLNKPGAFKELVDRLFLISQSLLDIKYNTNLVSNTITFNTSDIDSVKESLTQTIDSLQGSTRIFKTGIRRLNTLLSPGYMSGRLYTYLGLPASGKSILLLKSALDIRKYNPNYVPKTPGMKPCVLYITMENPFTETIERVWNMSFDEPITNYAPEEAINKLINEMGLDPNLNQQTDRKGGGLLNELTDIDKEDNTNIEVVIRYYPYRSISTDDLYTIIQDLREENIEVCALVLDYLKRIAPSVAAPDSVKVELNRIVNELKALAVIGDIPVITGHQMNRSAASTLDSAVRQGKGDVVKLAGRENVGDAWEVIETSDVVIINNIEYKPGTSQKYMALSAAKRRRVDNSDELSNVTYMAHPFALTNGLRLLDDVNLKKVLSLDSLSTSIDIGGGKEKTNAVQRLKKSSKNEFEEF